MILKVVSVLTTKVRLDTVTSSAEKIIAKTEMDASDFTQCVFCNVCNITQMIRKLTYYMFKLLLSDCTCKYT